MSNRIIVTVFALIFVANVALTLARPQNAAGETADVAAAIRYLQELETKHGQLARPRFGKRGGLIKTYNNISPYDHNEEMEDLWNDSPISG